MPLRRRRSKILALWVAGRKIFCPACGGDDLSVLSDLDQKMHGHCARCRFLWDV